MGNKAVTAMGSASVIHQIAIQIAEARTAFAESLNPSGWYKIRIKTNDNGPNNNPKWRFDNCIFTLFQ